MAGSRNLGVKLQVKALGKLDLLEVRLGRGDGAQQQSQKGPF
jgi:hypothetical protein